MVTGVEDVFRSYAGYHIYQSDSITGVTLKSVLMRNAPTALTADANGKASFTMNANMEQAYKTVYSKYHTPGRHRAEGSPFPPRD